MLCLVRSKACKRCGGDISVECDIYGVYAICIQCGANWSKEDLIAMATKDCKNCSKSAKSKQLVIPGSQH